MNSELFAALEQLEKIEAGLISAFKKEYGCSAVRVDINRAKKDFKVYKCRTVVEEVTDPKSEITLEDAKAISRRYVLGSVIEDEVKTVNFGRISAQTAKQVIIQAIHEAEKNNIAREYEKKREEVISAIVTRRDDNTGDVWVDTGKSEELLPRSEQIPEEELYVNDRVKVFVTEVTRNSENEPVVTLSRIAPAMIKRMFESEIPEIADGTVIIKGVSREPGSRTKIAVLSRDEGVDAVGACIGNKGLRIASIVDELRGEKIDVIGFSEHPEEYIAAALSPASVIDVEFDGQRSAVVHVAGDQLSLAIGKEGQNVRLAARLTGCKIDIKGVREQ